LATDEVAGGDEATIAGPLASEEPPEGAEATELNAGVAPVTLAVANMAVMADETRMLNC
jgi:hypothetical protein